MIVEWLADLWKMIVHSVSMMTFIDFIDIFCVAVLLYYVYRFIRQRRAAKLSLGLLLLVGFLIISNVFDMKVMSFLLQNVFQVGLIALVIVFQPELRAALEKVGGGSIKGIRSITEQKNAADVEVMIENVASALSDLSASKTGALVVFERTTKLGDLVLTGTVIDSFPAPYLIKNIFYNKAPLHDGALIIREGRLYAAGCLLPLSTNPDIIKDLGTRHRAAIGMSENSDAVVAVVSEETGTISVAVEGKLKTGFDREKLARELEGYLITQALPRRKKKCFDLKKNGGDADNGEG